MGLFLGDEEGEDVLLPNKYCPEKFEIGDKLKVFVYLDQEERKVATNITPKILLRDYAMLKVVSVSAVGAFLDWGMEKDLMVPFNEQRLNMEEGRWYLVYMDIDKKTDRLFASNKLDKRLSNENLTVEVGDEVDLIVMQATDLGFTVIVNKRHKGLVYENEIFTKINIGDKLKGYVKKIREDNKLDISLHPIGYENFNDTNTALVLEALEKNKGYLAITDKSSPEEIYNTFGMSKKAFKKAIGGLYKQRKITIEAEGIRKSGAE